MTSPSNIPLLPGDSLNFSFSPSSPPLESSFPRRANDPNKYHPHANYPTTSTISPALFSIDSASTLSISQTISRNLGPGSPSVMMEEDPLDSEEGVSSGLGEKRMAEEMEEDVLRRGPPHSEVPGGDCKNLCLRHQRMANGGTNLMLQKSLEDLPSHDQSAVNTMWSLFSSAPARRRLLILRGLLTIACPSQLTFLQEMLTLEMRLDPLSVLPREVSLKIFTNLDPISLGRAAQVSKSWKSMADDDLLWRTMCEQHIEKKCDKCGWGLPLLSERRRKARTGKTADKAPKAPTTSTVIAPAPSTFVTPYRGPVPDLATLLTDKLTAADDSSSSTSTSAQPMSLDPPSYANSSSNSSIRPPKRAKTESPGPSCCTTPAPSVPSSPRAFSRKPSMTLPPVPSTRPWKAVYCERLAVERNWRKGIYVPEVLSGHTDAITCLQVAEDLPHPNFPVLMTGSWDRSVRIWNLESGKEVGILRGHTRGIRALQFDALKLVTGSMDSTLKIWNWRTGECMRTLRGHNDAVICLTYDRQLLVSGSADSTIRVWDFGTGEGYTLRGHTEWVNSVALWDSKEGAGSNGHVVEGDIGAATSNPEAAKASSKGKFLISASDDMTIRVWDLYTRECVRVLKGHVAQVQSLRVTTSEEDHIAFPPSVNHPSSHSSSGLPLPSPDPNDKNRHQVVAGNAYEGFFDTPASSCQATSSTSPRPASLLPRPSLHLASALPPTPTGQIASAHARAANQPRPDNSTLPFLALEGDKKPWIVSASLDNTIKVWDVEAGVCQRTMFGHIEGVWDVDVDKLRIASASHDRTLKIWDRESGRCLHTLVGHTSAVTAVTLRDQYVVTGGDDGDVRIWNFAQRTQ